MVDITVVFAYLIITLVLGIWASKNVSSAEDYRTGGRRYLAWAVFATLSASYIGGGFTLGLTEKTFLYGFIYIAVIWGYSLKEIFIALFVVPRMQAFRTALTVGDIMETAFGRNAKIITGIASILVCVGIIGAQVSACGSIIYTFLGTPPMISALLAVSIVIIYSTLGGMKSVVTVDTLHFSVFALIIPLVLFFGLQEIGGITAFFQNIPKTHLVSTELIDLKTCIVLFISWFLGETLVPPYFQRLMIGKTIKETKLGTLGSGLFSIFFLFLIGCIGIIALLLEPRLHSASALPYVIQTVMPVGLKGLAIAAMLAVTMSTVDSFLNSVSITFFHDILVPLKIVGKNKHHELIITRLITVTIGVIALFISLGLPNSIDILLYSYQFWTPFVLPPFIMAIFGIRASGQTFLISTIAGIMGVLLWNFTRLHSSNILIDGALEGTIFGVILNSLALIICYRFQRKAVLT